MKRSLCIVQSIQLKWINLDSCANFLLHKVHLNIAQMYYVLLRCAFLTTGTVRVCNYCYKIYEDQKQTNQRENLSGSNSSLSTPLPSRAISVFQNPENDISAPEVVSTPPQVGSFPGDFRTRKISSLSVSSPFLIQSNDGNEESPAKMPTVSLKDPKKLMVLITQMAHPVTGIPLDQHRIGLRTFHACFLGRQLIQWMQKRSATTPKETALAIGQALIDFGHLKDLTVPKHTADKSIQFNEEIPYRLSVYQALESEMSEAKASALLSPTSQSSPTNLNSSPRVTEDDDSGLMNGPDWFNTILTNEPEEIEDKPQLTGDFDSHDDADSSRDQSQKDFLADIRKAQAELSKTDKLNISNMSCPELDEIYQLHQKRYVEMLMDKEKLSSKWSDVIEKCKFFL